LRTNCSDIFLPKLIFTSVREPADALIYRHLLGFLVDAELRWTECGEARWVSLFPGAKMAGDGRPVDISKHD
jgi:hypothetical protein